MTQFILVAGSGQDLYCVLLNPDGLWWNDGVGAYEAYEPSHVPAYAVALAETGSSGVYVGDLPSALPSGASVAVYRRRLGTIPSETDLNVAAEALWVGARELDKVAAEVVEILTQVVGVAT